MDFWDQSILGDIPALENVIVLRTCSKAFGLAGIRLGFAIARRELADLIRKAKSPFNVNSITQAVACTVLREKDFLHSATGAIIASREVLQREMDALSAEYPEKLALLPGCANFVLVETKYAAEIYAALSERDIKVRKFPDLLRITAGSDAENAKLMSALREIIENC